MRNSKIKSIEEAQKRLEEGEVFYTNQKDKLYYDASYILKGESPYRVSYYDGSVAILNYWNSVSDWMIDREWYENLGEGILCWVSDHDEQEKKEIALIVNYDKGDSHPFESETNCYTYAIPVTEEEVLKFIMK